jgi:hypothetical protein
LKELPSNLGEAFTRTLTRIQQQPVALSERAANIIAWIHFAERPLAIDELLYSLAIKAGDTCFNPRGIPVRETLLNCCHGLAVIDQETSTVRLVHYSLQQHLLQQNEIFNLNKAQWHSKIAHTCLTFLKFPPLTAGEALEQNHTTVTILHYAATQWGHHLRKSEELPGVALEFAKEYLLANYINHSVSLRLLYNVMYAYRYPFYPTQVDDGLPAHIAAYFGLRVIMLDLSSTVLNLDMEDVHGGTPLSWAAWNGHEAVVKVLIEKGAAVDSVDTNGRSPLSWAARREHEGVVKLMIEKGAAAYNKASGDGSMLLSWAAGRGHETVVKVLIEKGAAVDTVDTEYGRTPLSWAALNGHEAVVKLLIENGAAVDTVDTVYGRTLLSWAARNGNEAVVKLLIEKGAAVDTVDTEYGQTPLSWAVMN